MTSFFKSLLLKRNKLSDLESQVLDYILEKPKKVENYTSEELSKEIFVSTATISRTCKKLGFSGFQELKYALTQHLEQNPRINKDIIDADVEGNLERFEKETEDNLEIIGTNVNIEIVNLLKDSSHVEFFGVGNSLPICLEGARKMTFAGRIATARSDWDELRIVANNLQENDLAIIISLSGETLHIIEYMTILKENNVPIIAITGNNNNHLSDNATISLNANIQGYYFGEVDMSSRFPLSMILDLIILKYIELK